MSDSTPTDKRSPGPNTNNRTQQQQHNSQRNFGSAGRNNRNTRPPPAPRSYQPIPKQEPMCTVPATLFSALIGNTKQPEAKSADLYDTEAPSVVPPPPIPSSGFTFQAPPAPCVQPSEAKDKTVEYLTALSTQISEIQSQLIELKTNNVITPTAKVSKAIKRNLVEDMLQAYKDFKPRVPEKLAVWWETHVGSHFVKVKDCGLNDNPHAEEAILRRWADIAAVFELVKGAPEKFEDDPHITFVFGSEVRDLSIIEYYNKALARSGKYPENFITASFYGAHIVPEDLKRRQTVDTRFSQFAIFMDVYMLGLDPMHPKHIDELGFTEWIWVGHPFFSLYGGLINSYYVRYKGNNGQPLVVFKPDGINNTYPAHDPCDIMHTAGSCPTVAGTVSWSIPTRVYVKARLAGKLTNVIFYSLTRGSRGEHQYQSAPVLAAPQMSVCTLETFIFQTNSWLSKILPYSVQLKMKLYTTSTIYIDAALKQHVEGRMLTKYFNQWTWNACLNVVNEYLDADPYFNKCELLMPELFIDYRLRAAAALYVKMCKAKANITQSVASIHGADMYTANQALGSIGKETPPMPKWVVPVALGVSVGALLLFSRLRPSKLDSSGGVSVIIDKCSSVKDSILSFIKKRPSLDDAKNTVIQTKESLMKSVKDHSDSTKAVITNKIIHYEPVTKVVSSLFSRSISKFFHTVHRSALKVASIVMLNGQSYDDVVSHVERFYDITLPKFIDDSFHLLAHPTPSVLASYLDDHHDILMPVVYMPVLEEALKRVLPNEATSAALALLDVLGQPIITHDPVYFMYRWWVHTICHYTLGNLPLLIALPVHMGYNFCALTVKGSLFCTAYALCKDAQIFGVPCSILYNPFKLFQSLESFGDKQMIRQYDYPIFSLEEFDLAIRHGYYFESSHRFRTTFDLKYCFAPAQACNAKLPKWYDLQVYCTKPDSFDQLMNHDSRYVCDNTQGIFRYWAHQVPLARPDTSGRNSYYMLQNRIVKAPPAHLENVDDNPNIGLDKEAAKTYAVYDEPNPGLAMVADYFAQSSNKICCQYNLTFSDIRKMENIGYRPTRLRKIVEHCLGHPDADYVLTDEGFNEWLAHLPSDKKALMIRAWETLKINPLDIDSPEVCQITISSKTDEVLIKPDWVPRPIHRLSALFSVAVGPFIYNAATLLKKFFWLHELELCPCNSCSGESRYFKRNDFDDRCSRVTLTDLSGKTDEQISAWFFHARTTLGWHLAASGDDSLCIFNSGIELYIYEGDVSQCDHSVRAASLSFEWLMLYSAGVPLHIIDLLRRNSSADLLLENKHIQTRLKFKRSSERNTGSPDTTIGNTLIVLALWLNFVVAYRTPYDDLGNIQHWFLKEFGFSMKIKYWVTKVQCGIFQSPTILKGWFVHVANAKYDYWWSPLPSRLLKLSKVMTPPNVIFKKTKVPKAPHSTMTLDQAWMLLVAMHKGMAPFVNLPYMTKWRSATYHRYAQYCSTRPYMPPIADVPVSHESFKEAHRPQGSETHAQVCKCWSYMFSSRYHSNLADVFIWAKEVEKIIPGTFLVDPIWNQLALIDYC